MKGLLTLRDVGKFQLGLRRCWCGRWRTQRPARDCNSGGARAATASIRHTYEFPPYTQKPPQASTFSNPLMTTRQFSDINMANHQNQTTHTQRPTDQPTNPRHTDNSNRMMTQFTQSPANPTIQTTPNFTNIPTHDDARDGGRLMNRQRQEQLLQEEHGGSRCIIADEGGSFATRD